MLQLSGLNIVICTLVSEIVTYEPCTSVYVRLLWNNIF